MIKRFSLISDAFIQMSIFIATGIIVLSCSNHHPDKMTEAELNNAIKEVKVVLHKLTGYSEKAQLDSFLSCYDSAATFMAFSGDGKMRNFAEFKEINGEYYNSLQEQKIVTVSEKYNVIEADLVILGWTGNIDARFKNGDRMIMSNYSITFVFRKLTDNWKIIHSHESSLPPEIIKSSKEK